MLLLVLNNLSNDCHGSRVIAGERFKLVLEVSQHHALHCFRGERDRPRPDQAREDTQRQTAKATQMVTATAAYTTPLKFLRKQSSVALLVGNEFFHLGEHRWCPPARDPALRPINRNGPMLACVVDFQHHFARRTRRSEMRLIHSYEAYRRTLRLQRLGSPETRAL